MFVMMLISLYSSRIVLQALGKSDYGLYSVVGGFIAMFFFISNSLSVATERFMAYAIGLKDDILRKRVFSLSIVLYIGLAIVIGVIGIAIGVPFVKYKLNIQEGREDAALIVFLISLVNATINFVRIPYNAAIIANERMGFYSWISIIEATVKLLTIYLLLVVAFDKLETYAFLQMLATLLITIIYVLYCNHYFNDYIWKNIFDKQLVKKLSSFAGWNLYGGIADMVIGQGLVILFNLFFGTIINAAQALANQIRAQIAAFINNINIASGPAITKYYAEGNFLATSSLLFTISKMNFFMLLLISLPILFIIPSILDFWLGKDTYPESTIIFTRLILINMLIDTIPGASQSVVFASGNIKKYQFYVSLYKYISFILVFLLFELGLLPEYAYYVLIVCAFPRVIYQINVSCHSIRTSIYSFIKSVVARDALVTTTALIFSLMSYYFINTYMGVSIFSEMCLGGGIFIITLVCIYFWGLNYAERSKILSIVIESIRKIM